MSGDSVDLQFALNQVIVRLEDEPQKTLREKRPDYELGLNATRINELAERVHGRKIIAVGSDKNGETESERWVEFFSPDAADPVRIITWGWSALSQEGRDAKTKRAIKCLEKWVSVSQPHVTADPGSLPTSIVPGESSLNVLAGNLSMHGFPEGKKRFESRPEVPKLRLACARLFPGQPFSVGTIELLIAWFQEQGLSPDQSRNLSLSEAVRRLDKHTAEVSRQEAVATALQNKKQEQTSTLRRLISAIDTLRGFASPLKGETLSDESSDIVKGLSLEFWNALQTSGLTLPPVPDPNENVSDPDLLWQEFGKAGLYVGANRGTSPVDENEWLFGDRLQIPEGWLSVLAQLKLIAEWNARSGTKPHDEPPPKRENAKAVLFNSQCVSLGSEFEPIRNWLVARYLHDPDAKAYAGLADDPTTFDRFSEFTDYLVHIGAEVMPTIDSCRAAGWIDDLKIELFSGGEPSQAALPFLDTITRLNLQEGTHRLLAIRKGVLTAKPIPSGTEGKLPTVPESKGDKAKTNSPKSKRGRPTRTTEEIDADIRLYEDYLAANRSSGSTKPEFIRNRSRTHEYDDMMTRLETGRKDFDARQKGKR